MSTDEVKNSLLDELEQVSKNLQELHINPRAYNEWSDEELHALVTDERFKTSVPFVTEKVKALESLSQEERDKLKEVVIQIAEDYETLDFTGYLDRLFGQEGKDKDEFLKSVKDKNFFDSLSVLCAFIKLIDIKENSTEICSIFDKYTEDQTNRGAEEEEDLLWSLKYLVDYWYYFDDQQQSAFSKLIAQQDFEKFFKILGMFQSEDDIHKEILIILKEQILDPNLFNEKWKTLFINNLVEIWKATTSDVMKRQAYCLLRTLNTEGLDERLKPEQDEPLEGKINYFINLLRDRLMVCGNSLPATLGHYTSVETMVNHLIKEENEKNDPPYLRLTHSSQLNDPMEGKALVDYLDATQEKSVYRKSNAYLSSMTTAKDSLPMWKEYGNSSKGVFLEYDRAFLKNLVYHDIIEIARVYYLPKEGAHSNPNDPISTLLVHLKEVLNALKEQDEDAYQTVVDKQLSKIQYLFKVSDYNYEEEYRILVNFDDPFVKGKIEFRNSSAKGRIASEIEKNYLAELGLLSFEDSNYTDFRRYVHLEKIGDEVKLYVRINHEPLKYASLVLGPKVEKVDLITPYLHLVEPDIKVELSDIPYR